MKLRSFALATALVASLASCSKMQDGLPFAPEPEPYASRASVEQAPSGGSAGAPLPEEPTTEPEAPKAEPPPVTLNTPMPTPPPPPDVAAFDALGPRPKPHDGDFDEPAKALSGKLDTASTIAGNTVATQPALDGGQVFDPSSTIIEKPPTTDPPLMHATRGWRGTEDLPEVTKESVDDERQELGRHERRDTAREESEAFARVEEERKARNGEGELDLKGKEEEKNLDGGENAAVDKTSKVDARYRRELVDDITRGALTIRPTADDPAAFVRPARMLPRMFYFENTYLGGSAAYAERLRRLDDALRGEARPYEVVQAEVQPFDAPRTDGLGVTANIDVTHFERARRVFLQVGLRGSSRYGWRRPPLDVVLVVDQLAFAQGRPFLTSFVVGLLRQLGPSDRLGIVLAGADAPTFLELSRLDSAQQHLANRIDTLTAPEPRGVGDLAAAMQRAGAMLDAASDDEATVPGTKTLLVLSAANDQARVAEAAHAAHALTVQGCVTSVFALDAEQSEWWQVANAGFGNLHRITADDFARALDEEMQSLARVVARLVRVNVRLGKDAEAIRVLGTRVLEQREVEEVKAREAATDRNLSKSLGITSDRGEDDDGIQTVIPYFYGDDSHVILIELWVEGPGTIADVTVRYKDMVNLDNATARTSVRLGARPQPPTREQILIARNVRGFELAESLQRASDAIQRNDFGGAWSNLGAASTKAAETNALDVQAVEGLKAMVNRGDWQNDAGRRATITETLLLSGQRRVGDTNNAKK